MFEVSDPDVDFEDLRPTAKWLTVDDKIFRAVLKIVTVVVETRIRNKQTELDKEKTKAIADGEARIENLTAKIEELTLGFTKLGVSKTAFCVLSVLHVVF